jgi:hypothetical protein
MISRPPGVNAPHSGSSSSPVALKRFRRPVKVLPCCSVIDERREAAAMSLHLGDAVSLAGPGSDERHVLGERGRRDQDGGSHKKRFHGELPKIELRARSDFGVSAAV